VSLRDVGSTTAPREVVIKGSGVNVTLTVRPAEEGLVRTVLGIDTRARFGAAYEVGGLRGTAGGCPPRAVLRLARDLVARAFEATEGRPFVAWMKGAHARLYCRALGGTVLFENIRYRRADDCIVLFQQEHSKKADTVSTRRSQAP